MAKYDHGKIEKKWQKIWHETKPFKAEIDDTRPKYYVLDMFPYPSGAGLHVGHLLGYTATDILARYMRQKGYNVLHPMGWDSFGLPAEQYAIRTGTHPAITTHVNTKRYRQQFESIGYSYDWDRELSTSEPSYYKWTQWIFTKLYEMGLAYEADLLVNYCPALGTVLANEEIEEGYSKEGGHPVEKRPLKQWVLKITAYADRLIDDLDLVDWPESLKKLQKNWIGRSEGAEIDFPIIDSDEKISVFTTRPDTIFGVTYLVLSPEHPLVQNVTTEEQKEEVAHYKKEALIKSDLERQELAKDKTGVFTGGYALNPATGKPLPIWIGDYVLMGYGTGAIMAVPSHDERDHAFALKFGLPEMRVIVPKDLKEREELLATSNCWDGEGPYINSESPQENFSLHHLFSPNGKEAAIAWLEKKGAARRTVNYKLRDWIFSRQRYWGEPFPILHFEDGSKRALGLDELPLLPPEVSDFKPTHTGESPLAKQPDWVNIYDEKSGRQARRETNTMPNWAGSCWYYLRFCDPGNNASAWSEKTEKYWMPVDLYIGGAEHAVLHLLYSRFWHKVLYDAGLVSTKEPFRKLCNQGLMIARSYQRSSGLYISPQEAIERQGKYYHWETGEELHSQIEKMSKSKLNGVSPDEVIEEFGADALRLYSMFIGPIDKEKIWNTEGVSGCKRFLNRIFEMATGEKMRKEVPEEVRKAALKLGYRLLDGVTHDVEKMLFNTAIAKMMEFLNEFTQLPFYPKEVVKWVIQLLMPFAPHISEELWHYLGEEHPLSTYPLPPVDLFFLIDETVTYVVQVNGKVRGRFELPKDRSEEEIVEIARKDEHIAKFTQGKLKKVVFVPNKLLNFVIES